MAKTKTIEQRVADTILQRDVRISIGGTEYNVAPPSIGTLVIVSEYLTGLPQFSKKESLKGNDYVYEVLAQAKDCRGMAYAIAAIIIGSKHWDDTEPQGVWARIMRKKPVYKRDKLASTILDDVSPAELADVFIRLINTLDVASFFGVSTFLSGVHLTRPTKVDKGATARGQ